jgi:hypothetical protein
MNRPPVAPTGALLPASAPHAQVHAFGAPWANVGALVALVGESEIARLQRAAFRSDCAFRRS